jgi:hypothetical protein
MEKLDRLGWAAGMSLNAYGVRVGVRVNDPSGIERLSQHLPPGWKPAAAPVVERLYSVVVAPAASRPGSRRFNVLYGDSERLARSTEPDQVFESLESDLQLYVAETARRRVFVHAGVVVWGGRAIIIPGRSFSGKTTLVAEFVRAGATYYSDEYAVLDSSGRVHAYPKAMSIREPGTQRQRRSPAHTPGIPSRMTPLAVGLVLVTKYRAGARWRPRVLSAGQGVLSLLRNTVSARRQPEVALATLAKVVSRAPVLEGSRGEATEMINCLVKEWGPK